MANPFAYLVRRSAKRVADFAVSNPLIRWSWTGPAPEDYASALSEFRPSDRESVLEMMQGRYLLASKLVDTNGVSPFAIDMVQRIYLEGVGLGTLWPNMVPLLLIALLTLPLAAWLFRHRLT